MSINITPLDQQVNLKQFEPTFGGSNFDHSNLPLSGWGAERQQAKNNIATSQRHSDQGKRSVEMNKPDIAQSWIAKIANMFIMPRFAD
jgi:hypothetical protein